MSENQVVQSTTDSSPNGEALSPRLTQLELHGYKTFAHKTTLIFTGGITAIVGPNGSGKSNIADAVRWVLGEQSYSLLRGKRTEDMIFSGSEQRPRMGMATVSVTFDNASGWLPIEYTTVVLTRRAYRSGENEYFLNNTRVRLRDLQDLLATSGLARRSYTVIGQGLVDQALSLRPEERRRLIEEAAGITVYKRKRDQALSRLAEVQTNLVRVQDILAEIAPRLKRLERQADRARQYDFLQQELKALLATWYGYRWHQNMVTLEEARKARQAQAARLERRREHIRTLEQELARLRGEEERLKQTIEEQHGQMAVLHHEIEILVRKEAVARERQRGLRAQREALLSERTTLETRLQIMRTRLKEALAQEQALIKEGNLLLQQLETARTALAQAEAQRAETRSRLQAAHEQVLKLTSRIAQIEEQSQHIDQRIEALHNELDLHKKHLVELDTQRRNLQAQVEAQRQVVRHLEEEEKRLGQALREQELAIQAQQEAVAQRQDAVQKARSMLHNLRERFNWLNKLRDEGTGLYTGVRAVVRASHLPGIVGVVAGLLQVPPEYEQAIEVALGGALQDIVVDHWHDAEKAIAFLKKERAGRATFLPLDTLVPPRRGTVPKGPRVIGLAADVVSVERRLRPVVELLLNRTLLVEDLATARRVLPRAGGMRIVTLAGELVRSSGRVTGGKGKQPQRGMLAREREWRELPQQIGQAKIALAKQEQALIQAEKALQAARTHLANIQRRQRTLQRELVSAREEARRLEGQLSHLNGQLQTQLALKERLNDEWVQAQAQRARIAEQREALQAALVRAQETQAHAQERLEAMSDQDTQETLTRLESEWAVLSGRRQSVTQTIVTLKEDVSQQQMLLTSWQERLEALEQEIEDIAARLTKMGHQLREVQGHLGALEKPVQEAEARLGKSRETQKRLSEQLEAERRRLHQEESQLSQMTLSVQRAEDALAHLRKEIEADFGLVRLEEENSTFPAQEPLPLGEEVALLPKVTNVPSGLEMEVKRLRVRLRNLGGINPNAPEEYERLRQRHDFLQEQMKDLKEASGNLNRALGDLEQAMQKEFDRTYQAVARHFRQYFERLFGGGTARLVLTTPDDQSTTGIDVIARPPGKRTQGLAMLSGGERTLTAGALIFAILQVNPPPFCILDEVDAALDEANVGRFRDVLKELSHQTQFIVITHNRGTIEAANTIYGISMGRDGVSKTLSLRLEEIRKAA